MSKGRDHCLKLFLRIAIVMLIVLLVVQAAVPLGNVRAAGLASISGTVTDLQGQPIAGVWIYTFDETYKSASTDDQGNYTITGLSGGKEYFVQMNNEGYVFTFHNNVLVTPGQSVTGIDFTVGPGATIRGIVVNKVTGQPIANAEIEASWSNVGLPVKSGPDGSFSLSRLPGGTISLRASADGYMATILNQVDIQAGQVTKGIQIQLEPSGIISGIVTSNKGLPLQGLTVSAYDASKHYAGGATTDLAGKYSISPLTNGTYDVEVSGGGYIKQRKQDIVVRVEQETTDISFQLTLGGTISGYVSDDTGHPIAGVLMSANSMDLSDNYNYYATTDNNGFYSFSGVKDAIYSVKALSEEYSDGEQDFIEVGPGNRSISVDLQLYSGAMITGEIMDEQGQPIMGAEVTVYNSTTGSSKNTISHSDGTYTLAGLLDGTYSLSVYAYGYVNSVNHEVTVAQGQKQKLDFQLELIEPNTGAAGMTISGVVVDAEGHPISGARMSLNDADGREVLGVPGGEETNEVGHYNLLRGVSTGTYRVNASRIGYFPAVSSAVDVVPGQDVPDVNLVLNRAATISGKVYDQSGHITKSVSMHLLDNQGQPIGNYQAVWSNDGGYTITPLVAGTYTLQASFDSPEGVHTLERTITLAAEEAVTGIDFKFDHKGTPVSGYVVDSNQLPIPKAKVELYNDFGVLLRSAITDPNGLFYFDELQNGLYSLKATADGYEDSPKNSVKIIDGIKPAQQLLKLTKSGLTDAERVERDSDALTEAAIKGRNADLDQVIYDLVLISAGLNGSEITWSSSDTSIVEADGTVHRPKYWLADARVDLTATIKSGITSLSKTFHVNVTAAPLTDEEAIATDTEALTEDQILGSNPSLLDVTASLNLPTSGASGTVITWSMTGSGTVAGNGQVVRPTYLKGDINVTLTAVISRGNGVTQSKKFSVVVKKLPITDSESIYLAEQNFYNDDILGLNTKLSQVTDHLNLPDSGEEGTSITWTSDNPAIIAADGTVSRPSYTAGDAVVVLKAEFSKGEGEKKVRKITITVQKHEITDEEAIALVKQELNANAIKGENPDLVNLTKPLLLPATGIFESTISWASSQPAVLSNDGLTVVRPPFDASADTIVTLTATITRGTHSDRVNFDVRVKRETDGPLNITVLDEQSRPVANAIIMVRDAQKELVASANTDTAGISRINVQPGNYLIDVYGNGLRPEQIAAVVSASDHTKVTVSLRTSKLIEGKIETRQMTLQEIKNAGIDVNDSRNNNVYRFTVHLALKNPQTTEMYINGFGDFVGSASQSKSYVLENGLVAQPVALAIPGHPEMPPTIAYLVMPAEVKSLKEFFKVELTLLSDMPSSFALDQSTVQLKIPDGLTLADLPQPQSLTISLGSIQGETESHAEWIVRGDTKGDYQLSAAYEGYLNGFGSPIKVATQFVTEHAIRIWGNSSYAIHVKAEEHLEKGMPYHVRYELENVSNNVIYGLRFSIQQPAGEAEPTYVLAYSGQLDAHIVDSLAPGEKAIFDYLIVPLVTEDLDLTHSFVTGTEDDSQYAADIEFIDSDYFE